MDKKIAARLLDEIRSKKPLIHHITNYVTVNDCANITICVGASPVMADCIEEVEEMTGIANALVLNIGTLSPALIDSMVAAGIAANKKGIPVVLDPVGIGATKLRTESVLRLLKEVKFAVIKGNAGEIGVLAGAQATVRGVDSGGLEGDRVEVTKKCAQLTGSVIVMTGEVDIVSDGETVLTVSNGSSRMGALSGTGCMTASIIGAFCAVTDQYLTAAACGVALMGLCGQKAATYAKGPYSFRAGLADEMSRLKSVEFAVDAKIKHINP